MHMLLARVRDSSVTLVRIATLVALSLGLTLGSSATRAVAAGPSDSYVSQDEPLGFSGARVDVEPTYQAMPEGGLLEDDAYPMLEEPMDPEGPAPAVSSGEWLRSGLWYTQQSAVYMNRSTNVKNSIILSHDFSSSQIPHYLNFLQIPLDYGYQPGLRSTIGRFIGRDDKNRDHALEFTFLGLTHWQTAAGITAATPGGIFVDILLDPNFQAQVFNQADLQTFFASSNFNTYELNYRIERRLPRDQVVYTRDSTWVRQADPSPLPSVMAGIRVAFDNETLKWFSQTSIGSATYNVSTHNNMVGPQVGADWFYERTDWRVGIRAKAAALVNWASQGTRVYTVDTAGATLVTPRIEDANNHLLACLGELNFIGVYHLRPRFALRASYDLLFLTNQALAQNQVTFMPSVPPVLSSGHSLLYQGVSFGFEIVR